MKTVRREDYPADGWDHAQICEDGHVATTYYYTSPEFGAPFCERCGKATISQCSSCSAPIRGSHADSSAKFIRPRFCHGCGAAYPWTARMKEEWRLTIEMDEELRPDERERLKLSLDDLIADTPGTGRAVLLVKRLLPRVAAEVNGAARKILVEAASAAVKKELGI